MVQLQLAKTPFGFAPWRRLGNKESTSTPNMDVPDLELPLPQVVYNEASGSNTPRGKEPAATDKETDKPQGIQPEPEAVPRANLTSKATPAETRIVSNLSRFANVPAAATFALLSPPSRPAGLYADEVLVKLSEHGPNTLSSSGPPSALWLLWNALLNPFNGILIALAITSIATGDQKTFGVMIFMVVASTVLRFVQEKKSVVAATRLVSDNVTSEVRVLRNDGSVRDASANEPRADTALPRTINRSEVVPGDVVVLVAGDVVPGDGVVLEANNLLIDQSTLTGEVFPVERHPGQQTVDEHGPAEIDILAASNICLSGTSVVSGSASLLVVHTGDDTYIASIASALQKRPLNAVEIGIRHVSYLLIAFMLVLTPIVLVIQGLISKNWKDAFLFAISVAVGLTPEMLPMVVTSNLALGAVRLSRKRVIVKRLDAVQNLGGCNVLCSDKTGSLTMDKVILSKAITMYRQPCALALRLAYLNAAFQTGSRSLIDGAIVNVLQESAEASGLVDGVGMLKFAVENEYAAVGEVPFDSTRRLLSVALTHVRNEDDKGVLITKGAVQELLARCTSICDLSTCSDDAQTDVTPNDARPIFPLKLPPGTPLTESTRVKILETATSLNMEGLRVIGVAVRSGSFYSSKRLTEADERSLSFVGLIGFLDPPKPEAREAIERFAQLGVKVKILTGDVPTTAVKVARDIGLLDATLPFPAIARAQAPVTLAEQEQEREGAQDANWDSDIITGADLTRLSARPDANRALANAVSRALIFGKLSPHQKLQVVRVLRAEGNVTAFLGDGVNDSLALRGADVGISVDTGTEIAKDAADIVLLEKDLSAIVDGIVLGRITLANTIKYIKMTASSNFGNVLSVLVASAWLPFQPMQPLQILIQNLLYDFSQASIPWDNVDEEMIANPRSWDPWSIARFMAFLGPVSSVFDFCTFALGWWFFGIKTATNAERVAKFQSQWFVEGLLTQILVVYSLRTPKVPFLQSRPSVIVLVTTLALAGMGVAIPLIGPIARAFEMSEPYRIYWAFLPAILAAYMLLVHVVKRVYLQLFKAQWL